MESTSGTVLSRLRQPFLHGPLGRVAPLHPANLHDLDGVLCLDHSDVPTLLMHLNAKVEGEKAEINHLELALHLLLELVDGLLR
jgi:hypothetical protein